MEKINIAELLKDCPKGMELDCAMFENCTFEGIDDIGYTEILVKTPSGQTIIHECSKVKPRKWKNEKLPLWIGG